MTDEERQRTMDFILAQQAQFWASVQKHDEEFAEFRAREEERQARYEARQARHEATQRRTDAQVNLGSFRADRLERILKLLIKAGVRGRRQLREQGNQFDRRFNELMLAQAHSDKRLGALIDLVRQQQSGSA